MKAFAGHSGCAEYMHKMKYMILFLFGIHMHSLQASFSLELLPLVPAKGWASKMQDFYLFALLPLRLLYFPNNPCHSLAPITAAHID